jgi:hypothetical protein
MPHCASPAVDSRECLRCVLPLLREFCLSVPSELAFFAMLLAPLAPVHISDHIRPDCRRCRPQQSLIKCCRNVASGPSCITQQGQTRHSAVQACHSERTSRVSSPLPSTCSTRKMHTHSQNARALTQCADTRKMHTRSHTRAARNKSGTNSYTLLFSLAPNTSHKSWNGFDVSLSLWPSRFLEW